MSRPDKNTHAFWRISGFALSFAACLLALAFLITSHFFSQYNASERAFVEGKDRETLSADYIALYDRYTILLERNSQLESDLAKLEADRYSEGRVKFFFEQELIATKRFAGYIPVTGEGIVLTIDRGQENRVTANMLLQLVNELKAADATAICINNRRVTPVTEIRAVVGGYAVNRYVYSYQEPIEIKAVGHASDLYHSLQMIGGILDRWEENHVDFSLAIEPIVVVPSLSQADERRLNIDAYAAYVEDAFAKGA